MAKHTHTTGPWSINEYSDGSIAIEGDESSVALARVHNAVPSETMPNARLIAAAPELKATCQALLEELRLIRMKDGPFVYDTTCRITAVALLAKIEGK